LPSGTYVYQYRKFYTQARDNYKSVCTKFIFRNKEGESKESSSNTDNSGSNTTVKQEPTEDIINGVAIIINNATDQARETNPIEDKIEVLNFNIAAYNII